MFSRVSLERQAVFPQEIHHIIELFAVGNVVSHMQTAVSCSSTLLTVTTLQISLFSSFYLFPCSSPSLADPARALKYIRLDNHKMSHCAVSRMAIEVSLQLQYLC